MTNKITFVVGAGASKEFALPTGAELKKVISKHLDIKFDHFNQTGGDKTIANTLIKKCRTVNQDPNIYFRESKFISRNMIAAPSIDNFLHTHRERDHVVEIGKMAIARAMAAAERSSALATSHDSKFEVSRVTDTWLFSLFQKLLINSNFLSFLNSLKNISFVCFNYDRCIEFFLLKATSQYFELSVDQEIELLNAIDIQHVYGSLGPIIPGDRVFSGFGTEVDETNINQVSENIKIFTETANAPTREAILAMMQGNELIVFLGFSFAPLNMKVLSGGHRLRNSQVIGTGKGLSEDDRHAVSRELETTFKQASVEFTKELGTHTCNELMYEYDRLIQRALAIC